MTQAFPLQWPVGKPRTSYPSRSKFAERSIDSATIMLRNEIGRLRAGSMVLSTNLRLRNDGFPYSNQAQPKDQGVAVYFAYKGKQFCFACDRWDRIQDNIYAVVMTIEALRGIERWGSGDMVQQAFSGFTALPSYAPAKKRDFREVLGVAAGTHPDEVRRRYLEKAKELHPDVSGGVVKKMQELNEAYDDYKKERGIA